MPHPLLESDSIECGHKGKVVLQSSVSDLLSIDNAGVITLQDLAQAKILGCQNQILGMSAPCTTFTNLSDSLCSILIKIFSGALRFLEQAIIKSNAKIDSNNLAVFEQYDRAKHKEMFANICLSKKIQEIYKRNWLSTLAYETRIAYKNDIQYFMMQWKLTINEKHQSIASFVESFCEKANMPYPHITNINGSAIENQYFKFKYPVIQVKQNNQMFYNRMFKIDLIMCLRFFYIIHHSQNNSFSFHLQGYMRYIEINMRYFYLYSQISKQRFDEQPCNKDLKILNEMVW